MTVYPLKAQFSRGELSPRLHARADLEHYQQSLATCRNWIIMRQGGLQRRRGFRYIAALRDESEKGRLIRFEFDEEQAYALLFNDSFIRFFTLGGIVTQTPQGITGITQANPAVVTYAGSDTYANGDRVIPTGVLGMTEVNNREFTVANVNTGANTFQLAGIDSSGYTAYTSGGTVAEIYEIASPYLESDVPNIKFTQSGDVIYLAHPSYAPRKLTRTSETSWALATIAFQDGPWLDENEQGTLMTPASTGSVVPKMTNNTSPSGTASNSAAGANAYKVFDQTTASDTISGATTGQWSYDFASTNTKVADAYWIRALRTGAGNTTPTSWTFEGFDGSNWQVLDTRAGETLWGFGEVRYYEFINTGGYQSYRLNFTANDGAADTSVEEIGIHEAGDSQTAFNLTASAITGINGGAGFKTTDVGRTIRLLGNDAGITVKVTKKKVKKKKKVTTVTVVSRQHNLGQQRWRWAVIVAYTSSTVVTIRLYDHALADLTPFTRWQLSAWSADDGYPASVGFYDDRLTWAHSAGQENTVWASQTSDYENHGLTDPPEDTDAVNATVNGGRFNRIQWISEIEGLALGTPGGIRVMFAPDGASPFSSTNIDEKLRSAIGANTIQPLAIGSNLIYADRFSNHLHEFSYSYEGGGYSAKELSILSEHLFTGGISELAYQEGLDKVAWSLIGDGTFAALTYESSQQIGFSSNVFAPYQPSGQIAGVTQVVVAGGGSSDATVESCTTIPNSGGDDLYVIVKRTINGSVRRYVEYMAPSD